MEVASQSPVQPVLGLGMGSARCIWDLLVEVPGACGLPAASGAGPYGLPAASSLTSR